MPPPLHAHTGRAELTRTQQKFDSLQKLARGLSAENKALQEDAGRYRKQNDKVQDMLKVCGWLSG